MGRKTIFVDDLDGTELRPEQAETFKFAVGGERYELDVSHANADKLMDEFGKYVKVARNVTRLGEGTTHRRSSGRASTGRNPESALIREWAIANKLMDVGKRGRIPAEVIEKYHARSTGQQTIPAAAASTPPAPVNSAPQAPKKTEPQAPKKAEQSAAANAAPAATGKDKAKAPA